MDLTLLRTLLAVADTGAITAAANRLGLTQPALSRRIQQLEEEFGSALLARGRKGARLTPVGRLVASEARVLVSRYDNLRQQVNAHTRMEVGTVRLGGGATAVEFLVPPAIAGFQHQFPGVRFHVKEAGSQEIEEDVLNGRLELGLVTMPVIHARDLEVRPLFVDHVVLVAHQSHALAQRSRVALHELDGQSLVGFEGGSAIRKIVDDALRDASVSMNVVMELRSIPAILRMVSTTGNLAFVSRLAVELQPDISEVRLRGLNIERELALIARGRDTLSQAGARFAEALFDGARH
jgi:DNA-binding transcriptional LysR family regulator